MFVARFVFIMITCAFTGCVPPELNSSNRATDLSRRDEVSSGTARHFLAGEENGLEIRRLIVRDDSDHFLKVLVDHADGVVPDNATYRRLKRNGFRLLRLPVEHLDGFIHDLGTALLDSNQWHGQVFEWRAIKEHTVSVGGQAIAIGGHVERFTRGRFSLPLRCWTIMMEDGPVMHLRLVPYYEMQSVRSLQEMFSRTAQTGEWIQEIGLEVQFHDDIVYVLVGESPLTDWPGVEESDSAENGERNLSTQNGGKRRVGPFETAGPGDVPPMTLGELFFTVDSPNSPVREMLILVPRIMPELFPPATSNHQAEQAHR